MSSPRVLIIGCGYLGKRVGALCREQGMVVTGTTRNPARFAEIEALGIEPALLDLGAPEASTAWEKPCNLVLYSVAPGRAGDAALAFRDGAVRCARLVREPRLLVFISSTGVHGQTDGSAVAEDSPAVPPEERHRLLREGEVELLALGRGGGPPAAVLRLGGLYGPGRSPVEWLTRPEMRERLLQGGREAYMNWVRIEDAAAAVVLAFAKARPGETYLIVDNEPVRRGDFYRFAAERAGLPPPELPSRPDDLGKRCSNRKARRELGFAPAFASYREGLGTL